jgi:signal transduction histidine kinase
MSLPGPPGDDSHAQLRALIHDLRTPATIISGFADLLERGGSELAEERRAEYVGRIAEAARDLRALLDAQKP